MADVAAVVVNVNDDVTVVSMIVVSKSMLSTIVVLMGMLLMCVVLMSMVVVSVEKATGSIEVCCRLVPHLALVLARNDTMIPSSIRQTDGNKNKRGGKREK